MKKNLFSGLVGMGCLRVGVWLFVIALASTAASVAISAGEPAGTAALIEAQGYDCEFHRAWTEDGYGIGIHRIPSKNSTGKAPTILFLHGLSSNSESWVCNFPFNDFPFMLADEGFDVWLINFRGTKYSLEHQTLNTTDKAFWEFSWVELGKYDTDAAIRYIVNTTGVDKTIIVGHSEGGAASVTFLALEDTAETRKHVSLSILLCPAVCVSHSKQEAFIVADKFKIFPIMKDLGVTHLCHGKVADYLEVHTCELIPQVCALGIDLIAGWDYSNMNASRTPIYVTAQDCSSVRNYLHGFQAFERDRFDFYDYGSAEENEKHYNQSTPPTIPLGNIDGEVPIALYHGEADKFVVPYDVENRLLPLLGNATFVGNTPKEIPKWNHYDPVFAWDGRYFREMVDLCKKYVA